MTSHGAGGIIFPKATRWTSLGCQLNKRVIDREDIRLKVGQLCTHPTAAMPQGNGVVEAFKSISPSSSFLFLLTNTPQTSSATENTTTTTTAYVMTLMTFLILRHHHHHHQQIPHPHEKPQRSSSARSARNAQRCPHTRALSSSSSPTRWESPSFHSFFLRTLCSSPSKRRFFKCIPSIRNCQWQKCCWSVLPVPSSYNPCPHIPPSQDCPQIRTQCIPG